MKRFIKKLFFPVTLLTITTLLSLFLAVYYWYVALTHTAEFAIYPAVLTAITLVLILLYFLDRYLIQKVPYHKLILGELAIGILIYVIFSYQSRYTTINFHTNQDYILVIFDAEESSMSRFENKGLFTKELNLYNANVVHLDSSFGMRKDLRIMPPVEWKGRVYKEGTYAFMGDSIDYVFVFKESGNRAHSKSNVIQATESYIDSLLKQEIK